MRCYVVATRLRLVFASVFLGLCAGLPQISFGEDVGALRQGVTRILASVDGRAKTGAGFVVRLDSDTAYIVTASHVVEGDKKPRVTFFARQNTMVEGEVLKLESGDDRGLAVLVVRGKENLPPGLMALVLDAGKGVSPGDQTVAIGFPKGGGDWSISSALISGRDGRDLVLSGQIAEGNSGGPLIKQGKVVGVVTQEKQGFGRAVPSDILRSTLEGWGVSSRIDCRLADVTAAKTSSSKGPSAEAERYFDEAEKLDRANRHREAATMLRTAHELGHFAATIRLAVKNWTGVGSEKDEAEAIRLFRQVCNAAIAGNSFAQLVVGRTYELPAPWLSPEVTVAPKWYLKAAEQGFPPAQSALGIAYLEGRGVPKDYGEAMRWSRKAADNGDVFAQYNLGRLYWAGSGVDKNESEAVKWYRKAAERGLIASQVQLGLAYFYGRGVAKDYQESARWLGRTAAWGEPQSQYYLGMMLASGLGVSRDEKLAVAWWQKAARQGDAKAREQLKKRGLTW